MQFYRALYDLAWEAGRPARRLHLNCLRWTLRTLPTLPATWAAAVYLSWSQKDPAWAI